jgi:Domain of unknown function (DUF4160)
MPKIAWYKSFYFFFVAFDLTERQHLHVSNSKKGFSSSAKIWLDDFSIFEKGDMTTEEINEIQKIVETNILTLKKQIETYEINGKVKMIELKKKNKKN